MGGPLCDFGQGGGEDSRNQHAVVYDNVGDQATSHRVEGCTVVQNNHPWRATHHTTPSRLTHALVLFTIRPSCSSGSTSLQPY